MKFGGLFMVSGFLCCLMGFGFDVGFLVFDSCLRFVTLGFLGFGYAFGRFLVV